jgi:hypothetical protein
MRSCWLAGTRSMAAAISTSEAVERKTGSRCMSSQCRRADFCAEGAKVANKGVSISQVFNAFLSGGYFGSSRNPNPDDRGGRARPPGIPLRQNRSLPWSSARSRKS